MATITKNVGKRGSTYRVRIRKPNIPVITKTFKSKSLAVRWAKQTEYDLESGQFFEKEEASKHTLADLVDKYLEEELQKLAPTDHHARRLQLNWWKKHLGSKTLNQIKLPLLVEYRNILATEPNLKGKVRSGTTVNRYVAALSAAIGIAVSEWHWLQSNPFQGFRRQKENHSRARFLSPEERLALLVSCKQSKTKSLHLITVLALATGMRQAEIMSLRWDQVNFKRSSITLFKTKNGATRVVPLVGFAAKELEKHGKVRSLKNSYVFAGRKHRYAYFPRKAWNSALKRAGIEDFRFHDLRHSAASELAMNGASLHEIAAVLGHKTLAMVQRYAHLSEQHTLSVVMKMNQAVFGK